MIGKLLGKAIGEAVALPATVAAELVDAGTAAVEQAATALERAGEKLSGDDPDA